MDSEYLLGLGTWATCQNGISTTCYNSLEKRANEAPPQEANMGFYLLCPPLETVSKPKVLMGAWKCVYSIQLEAKQEKGLCALLLVDHFCSPSISFQLPSTNEYWCKKEVMGYGSYVTG
jgi:hypothetical protein